MGSIWWVLMFLSAWGALLVATNKEKFKAFWTGGLWIALVTGAESLSPVTDGFSFTVNNLGLALGAHGLRFLSLLGINRALNYGSWREHFIIQQKRRRRKATLLKASRLFWPVSWPFFSMSALMIVKGLRAFTKRSSTD